MKWGIVAVLGFQVIVFVIVFVAMCIHAHRLNKSSDFRMAKANEMVLTLAHSADTLSKSVSEMKDMMVDMEKNYEEHLKAVQANRDDFKDAYTKLLHKYERLEERIIDGYEKEKNSAFDAIRDMARKPMIHNNNTATDRG